MIKTGIPGLDDVLKGGVLEKSAVLISGGPGTGKSIFIMQFLVEGAKKGEPGLCILYDTEKEELLTYADSLGIPLRKYEQSGMIIILKEELLLKRVISLSAPLDIIRKKKIKRVALDSLTMFSYIHVSDDRDYRRKIVEFLDAMKLVTLFATAEGTEYSLDELQFSPEDFLFDGVIFLSKVRHESSFERVLHVSKLRGQEHKLNIYPFHIGKGGIEVYPNQLPFSLIGKDEDHKKEK